MAILAMANSQMEGEWHGRRKARIYGSSTE